MAEFPTIQEFAKRVADTVLDDYEVEGKSIREWVNLIGSGEAVEMVRCKDCKWFFQGADNEPCCRNVCGLAIVTDEDFCSLGERREDE